MTTEYQRVRSLGLTCDIQGWHYDEPIFDRLVRGLKSPAVYIEVGCYRGASLIRVAKLAKELGLQLTCIAVDFWRDQKDYDQFLCNVIASQCEDVIFPYRMLSSEAAWQLHNLGITADLIYIDADHTFTGCLSDMTGYYRLLNPGGVMFGDDFTEEAGVGRAVEAFGMPYQHTYYHWELAPKK